MSDEGAILVVDDDEAIRAVIAEALSLEGYPVRTARNGAEALELLAHEDIWLVLLDMRLPVLDGWEFARALGDRNTAPPIVVMTAARDAGGWAAEINAAGVLAKPFELTELFDAVERFRRVPQRS
jgi:two-component system chemotaxis response regulator CheY